MRLTNWERATDPRYLTLEVLQDIRSGIIVLNTRYLEKAQRLSAANTDDTCKAIADVLYGVAADLRAILRGEP